MSDPVIPPISKGPVSELPVVADCNGCGACCQHMGYPSYVMQSESHPAEEHWTAMPPELKAELIRFMDSYQEPAEGELDGVCCWYDAEQSRCKHHQYRPNVCRDFEVGSRDCLGWREVYFH